MKTNTKTKIKASARKVGKAVQLVDFDKKPKADDFIAANRVNKFTRKFRAIATLGGAAAGGWLGYTTMTKGLVGLLATQPMVATTTAVGALIYGTFFYGSTTAAVEAMTKVMADRYEAAHSASNEPKATPRKRKQPKVRPNAIKAAVQSLRA